MVGSISVKMERCRHDGMMAANVESQPGAVVISDTSGNWGSGAFDTHGEWFQLQWPQSWATVHITAKELLPIVACVQSGESSGGV